MKSLARFRAQTVDEITDQIGELLRKAREKAGLSIEDVSFQTRMPHSAIEALESENFAHFTSPVYAKSFLSQYSSFLNVEAGPWLEALRPAAFIEGDPMLPLLESGGPSLIEGPRHGESHGAWKSALVMLSVTAVLVFAAIKIFEFCEARFGKEVTPEPVSTKVPEAAPVVLKPTSPAPPKAVPMETAAPSPPKPPQEPPSAPRAIIVR